MDQHTFEKRAISSKKYTYLQYSVASALSKSSFFCITNIQDAKELYPDTWYEMHSHRFYSIIWFYSGEGTHIVDFDEYNIEKDSIFFLSPKHLHTFRHHKDVNGIAIIFTEDLLLHLDTELLNCIKAKLFYPIHGVSYCTLQENAKRKIERYAKLLQEESESNTKDTSLKYNFLASALSLFLIDIIRLGDWEEAGKLNVNSDKCKLRPSSNLLAFCRFGREELRATSFREVLHRSTENFANNTCSTYSTICKNKPFKTNQRPYYLGSQAYDSLQRFENKRDRFRLRIQG